ncbi:hypothetical protein ADUPG1_001799, partial [Aduncisulcus paluster]
EDFIDTCPIPMCKSPPMNECRAEELYKRMMIWGTDEDEAMKPNLWTAGLEYVPKLDEDELKGGKRRYTPKPKDVEHNHWKEFIAELEKEVTMQGDDEREARREFDKEKDEEESSESSKEHLNDTNATLKLNKDANVPETSKSNANSSVSKPEPKAKLNVRLLRKNQHALIDKMEKMKKSKELEKLDPMKMAWSVEPDEISDSEDLKVCVIAGRNHDDSGAVNVTVHVTRQLKKTVRAVMDTGADISLISREWLRDKARIWREVLFLEKQQEEYPVKPVKPPLIFKTVSGASETAHEAILMKTVVMTCGKRAKFTPHCCLIK